LLLPLVTVFILLDNNNGKRQIFTARGAVAWPRWSPDGKRLRFTMEDSSTLSSALWEVRAEGTGARSPNPTAGVGQRAECSIDEK